MARRPRTVARKRPTQERARRTVDAILEATAHVLVKDGYDDLSTNRVAERAGVSIGSLYQYFPNKESLVAELVDRYSEMLFELVATHFAELATAPPRELAHAMVRAMIETKRQSPRLAKVLREQIPRTGRLARYEEELQRIIEMATAYLTHHERELRYASPEHAAFLAVHMVDALTHAAVTQRPASDDEAMIAMITDTTTRFLVAEADAPAARLRTASR